MRPDAPGPARERVSDRFRLPVVLPAGHDEHARMPLVGCVEGLRQVEEVVPVSRHENTVLACGEKQLLPVGIACSADLVNAQHVEVEASGNQGDTRCEILVQEKTKGGTRYGSAFR